MTVTIFGNGYVGLVQGAVLADVGHDVVCVDTDGGKIRRTEAGDIPMFEPGFGPMAAETLGRSFAKILSHYAVALDGKMIALWGLFIKPRTNDIREASARYPLEFLWHAGAHPRAYDPKALNLVMLARTLADNVLFDWRNLSDPAQPARHGLIHFAIGRGRV